MSMTLILWKAPQVREADEAERLLAPYYENGDDGAFEPSESISAAAAEIRQLYPDDPAAMADADCPWSDRGAQTDRLLVLTIRWSASDKVLDEIQPLAREHDLVLYDPQGPDVHLPGDPMEHEPVPPATAFEWFKAVAIAAVLVALTYAAWLIPIGWLRWPAVIVAGFFAAAALFVVGAMIAGALGIVDVDEPPRPCHKDEAPL